MKVLCMAGILTAIMAASTMLASGLEKLSGYFAEKVREAQTGEEITEQGETSSEESEEETGRKKEKEFEIYRNEFAPPIEGMSEDNRDFINGSTKGMFLKSLADTLFTENGGVVDVEKVTVGTSRGSMNGEVSCEVTVQLRDEARHYICAYNPAFQFYVITEEAEDVLQTE